MNSSFRLFIICIAFLLGIYYCLTTVSIGLKDNADAEPVLENMENAADGASTSSGNVPSVEEIESQVGKCGGNAKTCANYLVQDNSKFYLINSKAAKFPGSNPKIFNNLEEYVEYLEYLRSQGQRCPVLFLQKTHDVQGKMTYKVRPDPTDPQNGLPPESSVTTTAKARKGSPDATDGIPSDPTDETGPSKLNSSPDKTDNQFIDGKVPETSTGVSAQTKDPDVPSAPIINDNFIPSEQTNVNFGNELAMMEIQGINGTPYFKKGGGEITGKDALNTVIEDSVLVDATRNDPPYNKEMYPSFDPSTFYMGRNTIMDDILDEQREEEVSPSAMDTNWGGIKYTNKLVRGGEFKDREINRKYQ